MLAIGGAGEEPVDEPLDRVGGLVDDERLHLVRARRQPRDIERHPAHERAPIGWRQRTEAAVGKPRLEKGVDDLGNTDRGHPMPLFAAGRWHGSTLEGLKRPEVDPFPPPAPRHRIAGIFPGRAHEAAIAVLCQRLDRPWCPRSDPRLDQRDLISGEGLVRRHRADGGILPADGPDKETRIGISRHDRRAGLAPSSKRRSAIEREAPLRILAGMTLQAADGQKGLDPAAERAVLRRGTLGSRRSEQR